MYINQKILAIIPARGGSKRLPNKNILPLNGRPLIAWTIKAALNSRYIDRVYVSTDNVEIKELAEKEGVLVPELRPDNLSGDNTETFPVVEYTIARLKEVGLMFDIVVLLQPTSPLRQEKDIDEAIEYYFEKDAAAIVSVTEMEHSPLWSNTLPQNRSMDNFLNPHIVNKRSQDLKPFYRLNGAIYINDIEELLLQKKFIFEKNCFAFIMNREKSIDIDESADFRIAELFMKDLYNEK